MLKSSAGPLSRPSLKRSYSRVLFGAWLFLSITACSRDEIEELASDVGSLIEQQDHEKARSILERSISEAEETLGPDHLKVGRILMLLGVVHRDRGDNLEAISVYERSRTILIKELPPGDPDLSLVQNNLALAWLDAGVPEMAEELLEEVLRSEISIHGPISFRVAASTSNLGALYRNMGSYDKAEPLLQEALRISETLDPYHPRVATMASNLAMLYAHLDFHDKAEPLYRKALGISEAALGPEHRTVATYWNNLGTLYLRMYRYDDAEWCLRRAVDILERALGPQHPDVLAILSNLATLLSQQGQDAEAERLHERVGETYDTNEIYTPGRATSLINQAVFYHGQGELELAALLYLEAEIIYLGFLELYDPRYADLQNNQGMLYADLGDFDEAEELLRDALTIQEAALGPDHPEVAKTINNLAQLFTRTGRHSEAMQLANRAISILNNAAGGQDIWPVAYRTRAYLSRLSGDVSSALADLETALTAVEDMRPRIGRDDRVRASLIGDYSEYFEEMVSWLLEAGEPDLAYNWLERGRARVLLDQLAEAQVNLRVGIPADLRTSLEEQETEAGIRRANLQTRITRLQSSNRLTSTDPATEIEALLDSLVVADQDYRRAYREIKRASPLWRDLVTRSGEPVGLSEIQKQVVPPNGLLLIYEIGDSSSHVFVVPPTGRELEVVSLDVTSRTLNEQIPAGETITSGDLANLQRLHEDLVPGELWDLVLNAEEVVVIPDGALHRLPFDALVVARDGEDASYWLDEGPPVRYAPSGTVLYNIERRTTTAGSGVLSLSGAIFDLGGVRLAEINNLADARRAGFTRAGVALDPLPYSTVETGKIQEAFGENEVTVLQGLNATEFDLRNNLRDHKYLHLATHGLVDEQRNTVFARLALTPVEAVEPDPDNDGFLDLREVYGLDLSSVTLAVLSACETNIGERFAGEGVFALSRGFLAAGAQRVVATQWKVDDEATSVLVGALFEEIARAERAGEEMNYAQALHAAKQTLRNDPDNPRWNDPSYWAPFIITGQR